MREQQCSSDLFAKVSVAHLYKGDTEQPNARGMGTVATCGRFVTRPIGRVTGSVGSVTRPIGRVTDPVGAVTRPIGRVTGLVVSVTRPIGRVMDSAGAMTLGRVTDSGTPVTRHVARVMESTLCCDSTDRPCQATMQSHGLAHRAIRMQQLCLACNSVDLMCCAYIEWIARLSPRASSRILSSGGARALRRSLRTLARASLPEAFREQACSSSMFGKSDCAV